VRSDEERIKRAVRSGEAAYEMWMAPMGIGTIPAKMAGGTKPGIAQPGAVCQIKLRLKQFRGAGWGWRLAAAPTRSLRLATRQPRGSAMRPFRPGLALPEIARALADSDAK
jgi:hypothetical protein